MARSGALIIVLAVVGFVVWSFNGLARELLRRRRRSGDKPGAYEWEPRHDQLSRRLKAGKGPAEDREGMLGFCNSRTGVEAYLEPRTVVHPLSVVFVAADGEWKRFELTDDAFLRQLSRDIGLPTFDAARVGYPPRMREYRRKPGPDNPSSGDGGGSH